MTRFLIEGGIVFMGILTLLFLFIVGLSVFTGIILIRSKGEPEKAMDLIAHIKSIALFALAFGVLSQILGLVDVFDYLAHTDPNLAPSVLAKGIKITFHPTKYGLIIYLVSVLITGGLRLWVSKVK